MLAKLLGRVGDLPVERQLERLPPPTYTLIAAAAILVYALLRGLLAALLSSPSYPPCLTYPRIAFISIYV
jgi:hypothetical protein